MIKNSRLNNIFTLFKVANETLEAKFVQNMLSSSFSDFESEEEQGEGEDLEAAFQELLDGDIHGIRHVGAIIFWILNANMQEQKRIGYAEDLFSGILHSDLYGDKFPTAIRHLSSGRHGQKGQVVLNTIFSYGKVKEALDAKTDEGPSHSNYRLFSVRELEPYFVNKYIFMINNVADRMSGGESGWRESNDLNNTLSGISRFDLNSKQAVFDATRDKIDLFIDLFDNNHYLYEKEEMSEGLINAFESILGQDRLNRLDRIIFNSSRQSPQGERGTKIYIDEVKEAISSGNLTRVYDLAIDKNMPKHEKAIVNHMLQMAKESDDVEFLENNIFNPFFYNKLNEKFPDLADSVFLLMAEKMPNRFLGIRTWFGAPVDLESIRDKYVEVAYRSLLTVSPNDFINHMNNPEGRVNDTARQLDLNKIFRESVDEGSVLEAMDPAKLAESFKYFAQELDDDGKRKVFNLILNRMDKSACEKLTDSLYHIDDEELKTELTIEFAKKIEENIEEYYKCFLDSSYKFTGRLVSDLRRRIDRKVLEAVISNKDSVTYFDHFYSRYSRGSEYALIPEPFRYALKRLEKIDHLDEAQDIHSRSHNDIDMEAFPDSKIKYSGYQSQQRPMELTDADVDRYELTQDNETPTPIMYDINKNNISAADFVGHTNLGSSGFTSAWALASFPEEKLLIEQIQSDYPVVLDRVFNRMPPTKKAYRSISYISNTGARFELNYKDGEGGAYVELKELRADESLTPELEARLEDSPDDFTKKTIEIMDSVDFLEYSSKAKEFEKISGSYKSSESEKAEAYAKASELYRDRAKEIRDRLDNLGLIPTSLHGLKEKYSEPELKDSKKHLEIISQNYPYLIIVNAMKTAKRMGMEYVYLLKSGGNSIQNLKKRKRIYQELPEKLEAEDDTILGLNVFRIPADNKSIEKVKSLMPIQKKGGYNYSLTPAQNGAIISTRRERERDARRLDQEKRDVELSRDKYLEGERLVKEVFHEAEVPYGGPEQDTVTGLLRYLGGNERALRQSGISKSRLKDIRAKIVNLRFAEIMEEFGLTKLGMQKIVPLYNLLVDQDMIKESEELYNLFDKFSLNNNLLLGEYKTC